MHGRSGWRNGRWPRSIFLNSRLLGVITVDNGRQLIGDATEAGCQIRPGRGLDAAIGTTPHLTSALLDDAPAGIRQAGSIPKMTMRPLPLFERLFYYNMSRHGSTLKTRAASVQGEEAEPAGG